MAQWSRADRTLHAKIVYYGPALGGKTTNLEVLQRLLDPCGTNRLITVQSADDQTLLFDLLQVDLGELLGLRVGFKLYTVPGQVRYDTTRQVVLSGADAVVFVADSSAGREEQNRWSLQNLRVNMRLRGLDPGAVPILFQFNKRDLREAAPVEEVAAWLGIPAANGLLAVAGEGQGVLETLVAATRTVLSSVLARADERTRGELDAQELDRRVLRAYAPYLAGRRDAEPESVRNATRIVPGRDDVLEASIESSARLGEALSASGFRARRLAREVETLRRLCQRPGPDVERKVIIDGVLAGVEQALQATAVSLVGLSPSGELIVFAVRGAPEEPLRRSRRGTRLLRRLLESGRPELVADLPGELGAARLRSPWAVAAVPVESRRPCALVAYAGGMGGRFDEQDLGFLTSAAYHLSVELELAWLHDELCRERGRTEAAGDPAAAETVSLLKPPLDAILDSAAVLRQANTGGKEQARAVEDLVDSARELQDLVEQIGAPDAPRSHKAGVS